MRLDKGFFSKRIAARMEALGLSYLLKVPRHAWLGGFRGAGRPPPGTRPGTGS